MHINPTALLHCDDEKMRIFGDTMCSLCCICTIKQRKSADFFYTGLISAASGKNHRRPLQLLVRCAIIILRMQYYALWH